MKKGFTLVEVIAVIVVLAVVALIVTPIIGRVIEKTKYKTAVESARGYISAANQSVSIGFINSDAGITKIALETGYDDEELSKIRIGGNKPSYVYFSVDPEKHIIMYANICINGYSLEYNGDEFTKSGSDYCHVLEPGYYDMDNNLIASWDTLVNDYGLDIEYDYVIINNGITNQAHQGGVIFNSIDQVGKLVIPNSITRIGNNAFYRTIRNLKEVVLPRTLKSIGVGAFRNVSSIEKITIPNSITVIPEQAFQAASIKQLNIPSSVTEIDKYAFQQTEFEHLTISKNVTAIASEAFTAAKIESITVDPENPIYDSRDNCNCIIEKATNNLLYGSAKTIIPDSVKIIERYAFDGAAIENVVVPAGVELIKDSAFRNSKIDNLNITSTHLKIASNAFVGSSLKNTYISSGVYQMSNSFNDIKNVESLVVDQNNPVYDSRDNCNCIIKTSNNEIISINDTTVIPNTVERIGNDTFGSHAPKNMTIPASVTYITGGACHFCSLSSLTFEDPYGWVAKKYQNPNVNIDFTDAATNPTLFRKYNGNTYSLTKE